MEELAIMTVKEFDDLLKEKGMTKSMKINAASILINSYKMFSDSPEDRRVIITCLKKVMDSLKNNA